uniref:Uncharacterized protein n=1 Tax=Cannabis sativa TaxID=3483 RepID=A0A803Q265_CANSA
MGSRLDIQRQHSVRKTLPVDGLNDEFNLDIMDLEEVKEYWFFSTGFPMKRVSNLSLDFKTPAPIPQTLVREFDENIDRRQPHSGYRSKCPLKYPMKSYVDRIDEIFKRPKALEATMLKSIMGSINQNIAQAKVAFGGQGPLEIDGGKDKGKTKSRVKKARKLRTPSTRPSFGVQGTLPVKKTFVGAEKTEAKVGDASQSQVISSGGRVLEVLSLQQLSPAPQKVPLGITSPKVTQDGMEATMPSDESGEGFVFPKKVATSTKCPLPPTCSKKLAKKAKVVVMG